MPKADPLWASTIPFWFRSSVLLLCCAFPSASLRQTHGWTLPHGIVWCSGKDSKCLERVWGIKSCPSKINCVVIFCLFWTYDWCNHCYIWYTVCMAVWLYLWFELCGTATLVGPVDPPAVVSTPTSFDVIYNIYIVWGLLGLNGVRLGFPGVARPSQSHVNIYVMRVVGVDEGDGLLAHFWLKFVFKYMHGLGGGWWGSWPTIPLHIFYFYFY